MVVNIENNFNYFLENDFKEYEDGEWVAIYKEKVISHGTDLKEVIKGAKKIAPMAKVLLSKVKKTASYL